METLRIGLISLLCTIFLSLSGTAQSEEYEELAYLDETQQIPGIEPQPISPDKLFIQAKKALNRGDLSTFFQLKEQLASYPLSPYLDYYYIRRNFSTIGDAAILQFMNNHPNSPMTMKLRRKWIADLAEQGDWNRLMSIYKPTGVKEIECYYLHALQQTGRAQEADTEIRKLWLTGRDQPDSCSPVFATWLSQIADRKTMLWQRFEKALKRYNFKLAKYLIQQMTPQKQNEARAILKLYAKPSLVTRSSYVNAQPSAEVISYGIFRYARRDPTGAIRIYNRLNKKYHFNEKQKQRIFQAIALRYALRKNKNSTIWFRKVVGYKLDPVYQEWLIRAALIHKDWALAKDSIDAMPLEERQSDRWQYWYARALEQLGEKQRAQQIYATLAAQRTYHGFLATKRLNKKIKVKHEVLNIAPNDIQQVTQMPAFQRAKLLYQLNQKHEARLELYYLMKHTNAKQQYIVLKQVSDWGWHSAVLRLSRHAEHKDDVIMRFPLGYKATVMHNANQRNVNPALVYAVIRQESAFIPKAHSPAGAVGLMQLMPQTAYKTSKQFKLQYSGKQDLLNGTKNIVLGCAHLKKLHQQLNNHPILVIAAYNAGRRAVNRWMPKGKAMPADIWVETIPFYETRNYIKNVIAYYVVYQHRLGLEPTLTPLMKSVK